ncbi:MAG: peptide-methionine (S)-S-oxide reductase MsrA [Candidatus Harrisonbacteria bacterium]|nr:peptide-methionine (S)-S-oxide reductase MsrA [Candidatus Harrisonbacteria bacterium]
MNSNIKKVAFGGGCFWCTEAVFLELKGVVAVTSGYAGGTVPNPSYEAVSSGATGHAEVVLIEYDPNIIPFAKLLEVFFESHDPTELNRQGNDIGTQYRSIILCGDEEQQREARAYIEALTAAKKYQKPIVTEVVPLAAFYPAEEEHERYYARHSEEGYARSIIKPKVEKVRNAHPELLKGVE